MNTTVMIFFIVLCFNVGFFALQYEVQNYENFPFENTFPYVEYSIVT